MPLTPFQRDVPAAIVANRSEASHFAGGLVINADDDSSRYSKGFDMPIGVAFVDKQSEPGWIGRDRSLQIHRPSLRGCWPVLRTEE